VASIRAVIGHADNAIVWATLGVAVVFSLRRLRRVVGLAIVVGVLGLVFESGIHSVHHLGDDFEGSQCVVASATSHLAGTHVELPSIDALCVARIDRSPTPFSITVSQPFRADAGRAPPA
jgi:hypothetical protein